MADSELIQPGSAWLEEEEDPFLRERIPMVYVEAIPVRIDHLGIVNRVGLLLRPRADGTMGRSIVSGRVLYGETIRDALWRNLTNDLGPDAEPMLPPEPAPFTVAEYFPTPERTGFSDSRQHAVSLVYVVPVTGDCVPSHDALQFSWMSVEEATSPLVATEMSGGQDRLVRMAMAHVGQLL